MAGFKTHSFAARGVRSLCWRGDELIDWVGGGRAFSLHGAERNQSVNYTYRFDAAAASPDGRFAMIYERLGTKALVLEDGKILRELDRSFYCAGAYEFPAVFFQVNGRPLLAHCPESYCRLDFEDVETGERLTVSAERKPSDFFHSRLMISPGGKRLLSAGWIWHPWDEVFFFDVAQALADPRHLDRGERTNSPSSYRHASACWLDDDRVVLGGSADDENLAGGDEEAGPSGLELLPRGLAIYDVPARAYVSAFQLDEPPGTIFAVSESLVLSLYRHPKLIDLSSAAVIHTWTELNSGLQDSSIIWHLKETAIPPPMTFDAANKRFAIANSDTITIIEFA